MRAIVFLLALLAAAPVLAQPKSGDKFGDWLFTCKALGPDKTECGLTQTVTVQQQGQAQSRILSLYLQRVAPGEEAKDKTAKIYLFAIVPLGIFLPSGIAAKVDQGEQFEFAVRTCVASGCEAVVELDEAKLTAMRAGQKLLVGFKPSPAGKTIVVPASLNGITKGLAALP